MPLAEAFPPSSPPPSPLISSPSTFFEALTSIQSPSYSFLLPPGGSRTIPRGISSPLSSFPHSSFCLLPTFLTFHGIHDIAGRTGSLSTLLSCVFDLSSAIATYLRTFASPYLRLFAPSKPYLEQPPARCTCPTAPARSLTRMRSSPLRSCSLTS